MAAPREKPSSSQVSNAKSKRLRNFILFLCLIGLCISIFGLYVEILKERNPSYRALCDVNSYVSCSRALTSRFGKGFGLVELIFSNTSILNQPNTVYGMAFYTFQATLALNPTAVGAVVQTVASILANIGSVYLGYILAFIIQDFCLICLSTYLVNFLMLVASVVRLRRALDAERKNAAKKRN